VYNIDIFYGVIVEQARVI